MFAAEGQEGDGASGRVVRVHGMLFRRKGNKEPTIVGMLVAINFDLRQLVGLSVPMKNPLIGEAMYQVGTRRYG